MEAVNAYLIKNSKGEGGGGMGWGGGALSQAVGMTGQSCMGERESVRTRTHERDRQTDRDRETERDRQTDKETGGKLEGNILEISANVAILLQTAKKKCVCVCVCVCACMCVCMHVCRSAVILFV